MTAITDTSAPSAPHVFEAWVYIPAAGSWHCAGRAGTYSEAVDLLPDGEQRPGALVLPIGVRFADARLAATG